MDPEGNSIALSSDEDDHDSDYDFEDDSPVFDFVLSDTLINFLENNRRDDRYLLHPGREAMVYAGDMALVLCDMSAEFCTELGTLSPVHFVSPLITRGGKIIYIHGENHVSVVVVCLV